jgi:hypothetical protein
MLDSNSLCLGHWAASREENKATLHLKHLKKKGISQLVVTTEASRSLVPSLHFENLGGEDVHVRGAKELLALCTLGHSPR